jgi:hypothetical protein
MAVNPNTNFTAGQILTADQQNRFPRGVMGYAQNTTDTGSQAAGFTQTAASVTFTAVANRYYRITYVEPLLNQVGAGGYVSMQIKNNTTLINSGAVSPATLAIGNLSCVQTFTAGSVTINAIFAVVTNNCRSIRSATEAAFLCVEDIGPA